MLNAWSQSCSTQNQTADTLLQGRFKVQEILFNEGAAKRLMVFPIVNDQLDTGFYEMLETTGGQVVFLLHNQSFNRRHHRVSSTFSTVPASHQERARLPEGQVATLSPAKTATKGAYSRKCSLKELRSAFLS